MILTEPNPLFTPADQPAMTMDTERCSTPGCGRDAVAGRCIPCSILFGDFAEMIATHAVEPWSPDEHDNHESAEVVDGERPGAEDRTVADDGDPGDRPGKPGGTPTGKQSALPRRPRRGRKVGRGNPASESSRAS